ncbi:MAG: D-alanine--D-alanine ligase [Eggerthellaceae bacterium]|nr:D-alanine--D-alanine ligase [Eggerthellaceae bacterium]
MKVAVLMGGSSFEREFSLASGKQVCTALELAGHKVVALDTTKELVPALQSEKPDVCYSALHGKHGEDGTIQSLLEFLGIPFVGSPAAVCHKTWNKSLLPSVIAGYRAAVRDSSTASWPYGICIARDAFKEMGAAFALDTIEARIPGGFPLAVKPACGGSAMGVHKVERADQLGVAILDALSYDSEVIIQQWISGVEVAVSILGDDWDAQALPIVEIVPASGMYLTEARLSTSAVRLISPIRGSSLSDNEDDAHAIRSEIEDAALEVYRAYGARDLGRVDIIWDGTQARVLEIDVSPGMTPLSLFPAACNAAGISLPEVFDGLVSKYA